jgi:hypothetical protein
MRPLLQEQGHRLLHLAQAVAVAVVVAAVRRAGAQEGARL